MRQGGSYIKKKNSSEPELVERTIQEYEDGGPRDEQGRRLDGKGNGRKANLKVVKNTPPDAATSESDKGDDK